VAMSGLSLAQNAHTNAGLKESDQQFIPKEVKMLPRDSVAELLISYNSEIRLSKIDNKKIVKNRVVLKPGEHLIEYSVRMENEEWKSTKRSLEAQGYTLQADGSWEKRTVLPGGDTKIMRPNFTNMPEPYIWPVKSKKVVLEKGKVYGLEDLLILK